MQPIITYNLPVFQNVNIFLLLIDMWNKLIYLTFVFYNI